MSYHNHPPPVVYLIGGPPGAGKSTLGTALATRLGIPSLTIDDLVTAVQAVTTPVSHPGLHLMWQRSHLDYFTNTPVDQLVADARNQHEAAWAFIQAVIRKHVRGKGPVVIDGWHLWPEKVASLTYANVWATWIHIEPAVLRRREEENTGWLEGSENPDLMLDNFMGRSLWFNTWYADQAAAHDYFVLHQNGHQSVETLCETILQQCN